MVKIKDGCDCQFIQVDFNNDGMNEIIATQFFSSKLSLTWTTSNSFVPSEKEEAQHLESSQVKQRIIDDVI